jgi:hypothetical protein
MENNNNNNGQYFDVYCNGISITTSPYDFNFFLNNNSPSGDKRIGEIKMSPEHAKVFAHMLLNHVKNYEELFGTIPQLNEDKMRKLQSEGKIQVEERK